MASDDLQKAVQDAEKAFQNAYNNAGTLLAAGFIGALVLIGAVGYAWSKRGS